MLFAAAMYCTDSCEPGCYLLVVEAPRHQFNDPSLFWLPSGELKSAKETFSIHALKSQKSLLGCFFTLITFWPSLVQYQWDIGLGTLGHWGNLKIVRSCVSREGVIEINSQILKRQTCFAT